MIPSARVALGVAALGLLASGSHAAGLFLPVDQAGAAVDGGGSPFRTDGHGVGSRMWERRVRIARPALTAAHKGVANVGAGSLLLNVRDGVRLDVVVERTAPTKWGYSLSGRVVGRHGGFVTLVVHEEAVAGSIWTPDVAYELSFVGGGVHALTDVTDALAPQCGGRALSQLSEADVTAQQGDIDDGSLVDILVVWTPAAEEGYGGEPQVMSQIDITIAATNDALERSGALVSLRLVGAERVDYLEDDSADSRTATGIDLGRLASPDDGHMDQVHDRRDALGADLVYLLTARGSGRASLLGSFAVGGARVFAHEVGHNFGIGHERYEFLNIRGAPYQYGFTTKGCDVTIMSYGVECFRGRGVPFYASPWRYSPRDGGALGVTRFSEARGVRGPADAVLTLNRNRHPVANFRPSRKGE